MNKGKVLIAAPVHKVLTEGLENIGYQLVLAEDITQGKAFDLIKDCVGVITSTRLLLDKELIDAAPLLLFIGRMGSGMEIIDTDYAFSKQIKCFSSPEGNRNAVAEHALGMLLSIAKNIATSFEEVKEGKWLREENRGTELEGKTIGIIGFGNTGRAFAKKLSGFDMRILIYDKYNWDDLPTYVEYCNDLKLIFETADIISFHVPLQTDTFHYFDAEFLTNMKKNFILLNTSRGAVVDTNAVYKGLEAEKIKGVCLDVLEKEPIEKFEEAMKNKVYKMMQLPQVLITPHIAGYSKEALYKMSQILLNKIVTFQ